MRVCFTILCYTIMFIFTYPYDHMWLDNWFRVLAVCFKRFVLIYCIFIDRKFFIKYINTDLQILYRRHSLSTGENYLPTNCKKTDFQHIRFLLFYVWIKKKKMIKLVFKKGFEIVNDYSVILFFIPTIYIILYTIIKENWLLW